MKIDEFMKKLTEKQRLEIVRDSIETLIDDCKSNDSFPLITISVNRNQELLISTVFNFDKKDIDEIIHYVEQGEVSNEKTIMRITKLG